MDNNLQVIGSRIYSARKSKGLKQNDVSSKIGICQSTYSRLENGEYDIPLSQLIKLCSILDISISSLVGAPIVPNLTPEECLELEKFKQFLIGKRSMK